MPCYHPLAGYRSKDLHPKTGKPLMFVGSGDKPHPGKEYIPIPCGRCVGCRLERSRQWAVRCVHEASLYKDNCFITLTYNDMFVPMNGSLDKSHFQKFMKRLRKRFGSGVRYFQCGEYGELLQRPHFHACLFNFDFPDKKLWSIRQDVRLYRSKILEELWSDPCTHIPFGFATVGDVTFESAAYVARYVVKKINGDEAGDYYDGKTPEFVTMSRRPGIAYNWFKKWHGDVFPADHVIVRGKECKPARYYDNIYEKELTKSNEFAILKENRVLAAKANPDNSYERIKAREIVAKARLANLRRGYEAGRV